MPGGGVPGRTKLSRLLGLLLFLSVLALLCPARLEATVTCPEQENKGCICDSRKGENQRGGWEISCTDDNYRIEYAIRSFVKLECFLEGQKPPYTPAMFNKYNLTDVDYFQIVMCALPTNLTFNQILEGVTVKKFKFEGDIPGIYFDSLTFQGLKSLQSLSLRKNQLESVPEDLFRNLTLLKSIELNENSLKLLPESLFEGLSNLVSIQLGVNELEELPPLIFTNLTKLQRLYLYKNKLKELPAGIFLGLKSLNVLDFANNLIQELHHELFLDTPQLMHLNIRGNNLTRLQSDMLHGTKRLEDLDISDNRLTKLPENLLEGLNALKKISLNNCNLKGIGESFFAFATRLTTISMYDNRLTSLARGLFEKNLALKEIFLQYNDILELPVNIFDKNFNLTKLKLTHNNLTSLSVGVFDHLSSLVHLDLTGNLLKTFSGKLLLQNQKLEELYVAKNKLTELEGDHPFGQSSELKIVDFSDNQIKTLPDWINWGVYLSLEKLSMQNNNLTFLTVPEIFSFTARTKLELMNNQIRSVNLEHVRWLETAQKISPTATLEIDLEGNPLNCDCKLLSFVNYAINKKFRRAVDFTDLEELECRDPSRLSGIKLTDIRAEEFVCQITDSCPWNCQCIDRPVDRAIVVNCFNLTELPYSLPTGTTEVHLEDNRIENLDALGTTTWENVTKLYLDRNNITVGDWNLPVNLKVLSLKGNQLEHVPQSLTDYVENHHKIQVYLGDNPWLCDCETLHLKDWLYENVKKVMDINDMYCSHPIFQNGSEVRTTVGRLTEDICPEGNMVNNGYLITVSVICVILAIMLFIVSVLYYRNKQTVIAYFYIHFHNVFVCFFNDDDLDEDKTFDAFVSYSTADRDVAMDLVGHLENGDPKFKLCIHERDWLPGNLISWNIVNSVQNSRKTILVLSKHFLDSVWFQVEFHTAYYQMLEDRIDRLIVIVRGDLPEKNTLDKDLQYLLSTKTFLIWGERWFWEKLRYALPHRRGTSKGMATKATIQDKSFPLKQRPNPGLLKTVEEKIASLSGDTIFSKRTESPRNGEVQVNTPPDNSQVTAVKINSTNAQSRRFNSAKTNASQNGSQNNCRDTPQDVVPV